MQWTGIDALLTRVGLFRLLPRVDAADARHAAAAEMASRQVARSAAGRGPRRARVALFTGCAGDAFFPETNMATARVLQKNGCEVWVPRTQGCLRSAALPLRP